jgi:hypothetical protein
MYDEGSGLRVYRGLLQQKAPAFDPGLQVVDSFLGELDQLAISGKTGSMNPGLWQTKNRGKLRNLQLVFHEPSFQEAI